MTINIVSDFLLICFYFTSKLQLPPPSTPTTPSPLIPSGLPNAPFLYNHSERREGLLWASAKHAITCFHKTKHLLDSGWTSKPIMRNRFWTAGQAPGTVPAPIARSPTKRTSNTTVKYMQRIYVGPIKAPWILVHTQLVSMSQASDLYGFLVGDYHCIFLWFWNNSCYYRKQQR